MTRADDDRIVGYSFRRARFDYTGARIPIARRCDDFSVRMRVRNEDGSTREVGFLTHDLPEPTVGMAIVTYAMRLSDVEWLGVERIGHEYGSGRPPCALVVHLADGRSYVFNVGCGATPRGSIPRPEEPCPPTPSP